MVTRLRQRAGVARRHEQVLAAPALVRAGHADVRHEAELGIVDRAEHAGRHFEHDRPLREIGAHADVDRRGIRREQQRAGIDEILADADAAVGRHACRLQPFAQGVDRRGRDAGEEDFHAAREIQAVVHEADGVLVRQTVDETEVAETRVDLLRRHDRRGHLRCIVRRIVLGAGVRRERDEDEQ